MGGRKVVPRAFVVIVAAASVVSMVAGRIVPEAVMEIVTTAYPVDM